MLLASLLFISLLHSNIQVAPQKSLCIYIFAALPILITLRYETMQRKSKSVAGLKLKLKPQSCVKTTL